MPSDWRIRVTSQVNRAAPRAGGGSRRRGRPLGDAGELARRFGLTGPGRAGGLVETLYRDFPVCVGAGQIVAVVGPSGAGKSTLLKAVSAVVPEAVHLDLAWIASCRQPAIEAMLGRAGRRSRQDRGSLPERLEILSRCGLAEAPALLAPACRLSGGQQFRLALASGIWRAAQASRSAQGAQALPGLPGCVPLTTRPPLLVIDEFAAALDAVTAMLLARQMPRLVRRYQLAVLLSTPRQELLEALEPARVIVKPLGGPPRVVECPWQPPPAPGQARAERFPGDAFPRQRWRVTRGSIVDYRALAQFHYLAGPPAAHKRVYVVRASPPGRVPVGAAGRGARQAGARLPSPGREGLQVRCNVLGAAGPELAAVLMVSPPVLNCRGRNAATAGRYVPTRASRGARRAAIARLNADVECISRVIVHPMYRSCGLAVRLVRRALREAGVPRVEALAAMGSLHPFFELAGMTNCGQFQGRTQQYTYYLWQRPHGRTGRWRQRQGVNT